jgi:hypothetical protein
LAGIGFGYLGDDCVAMATVGWSLRLLPRNHDISMDGPDL